MPQHLDLRRNHKIANLKTFDNYSSTSSEKPEVGDLTYFNRYDPVLASTEKRRLTAKENGNTQEGDGYKYRGRGCSPAHGTASRRTRNAPAERTSDATLHLSQFYERNNASLTEFLALGKSVKGDLPDQFSCNPQQTEPTIAALLSSLKGVADQPACRRQPAPGPVAG